jgi:hypothetical protein
MRPQQEKRQFQRARIDVPVEFTLRGSELKVPGVAKDISVGGMFIETTSPAAFGSGVRVGLELPGHTGPMLVAATVRWTNASGMGVQFGLLGARETHAITEIVRTAG